MPRRTRKHRARGPPKAVPAPREAQSFFPGCLGLEQPAQLVSRRQRPIEQCAEFRECPGVDGEERLIEQHVLRFATSCVAHEFRSAAAESFGGLVDEVALSRLGANVDRHCFLTPRLSHSATSLCIPLLYNSVLKVSTQVGAQRPCVYAPG